MSRKSTTSLNTRLAFIMGIFTFLILGIVGVTFWITSVQKKDTAVINLAGRQRMLTQKFTKEFLDEVNDRQVVASAQAVASTATTQIKADRSYYTKNVIGKLKKDGSGFKAGENYHETSGSIPLPATYVREVSESLGEDARYHYDLLSKWNINKDKGLRDSDFEEAWDQLSKNPQTPIVALVPEGQGIELHYATADVASAAACVSCHNNHPDSPKTDFKLGDLMGVLVVSVPVTNDLELARKLLASNGEADTKLSDKTKKLFELTLSALRSGGESFSDLGMTKKVLIAKNQDPDIEMKLASVEGKWNELGEAVAATRSAEADFNSAVFVEAISTVRKLSNECLGEMNAAVATYQKNSEARTALMRNVQVGALVIAVAAFFVSLCFIRRRITNPINDIIAGITDGAEQVNGAAGQVSSTSQVLAEGTGQQASSLEETSSALEEMASVTRTNAENAKQANSLSTEAQTAAEEGDAIMQQLTSAMDGINDASGQISKIIKVIEEIAFQTNLLALNAAVEAARAGEHGKGFAVVADEVRNLAQRAAQAAQETTGLIEDSVRRAKEGSDVAGRVGNALVKIATDVSKVTKLIDGIDQASQEQAEGVDQINTAVTHIDSITQQNAASAEESASASEQLHAQSQMLKTGVTDLATLINGNSKNAAVVATLTSVPNASPKSRKPAIAERTGSAAGATSSDSFLDLDEGLDSF